MLRQAALQVSDGTYSDQEVDWAIQAAGSHFMREAWLHESDESLVLPSDQLYLSTAAVPGFKPDNLMRAGIIHPRNASGTTWAEAIAYLENEAVEHDGSWWAAQEDHTSDSTNEPGLDTTWADLYWDEDIELKRVDYSHLARTMDRKPVLRPEDRPSMIAFQGDTTAAFWQKSAKRWGVRLFYRPLLVEWTAGTGDEVALNIPQEHIREVIWWGAAALLDSRDLSTARAGDLWRRFLEHIERVKGRAGIDGPTVMANAWEYL